VVAVVDFELCEVEEGREGQSVGEACVTVAQLIEEGVCAYLERSDALCGSVRQHQRHHLQRLRRSTRTKHLQQQRQQHQQQ